MDPSLMQGMMQPQPMPMYGYGMGGMMPQNMCNNLYKT